jgi:hypothetical protein
MAREERDRGSICPRRSVSKPEDIMSTRRSVLRLIGLAPIAGPVAAKEAAASMGLSALTSVGSGLSAGMASVNYGSPVGGENSWVNRAIATFNSPAKQRELDARAKDYARILDPDIAAMRSLSPAAAYHLQRARARERVAITEMQWLKDQLEQEAMSRLGLS